MSEQAPKPVLTQEQEPATRIQDPEKAYWMGHAMVANMDKALQLRHESANPFENTMRDSQGHIIGAKDSDISRANAIQYEKSAGMDARQAERAYDDSKNGLDNASRNAGQNKLDELTKDVRLPRATVKVEPNNVREYKTHLELDDSKKEKLGDLHETLFMQESQKILFDSRNVKREADKLASVFATGSGPNVEKAAKLSISNFNSALRDYFNPSRITEWQKRGQLNHAPREINDSLRSIALTARYGSTENGRFKPEPLDIFKDPERVTQALESIGRTVKGADALAIAQKSMRLLSRMQSYETIRTPSGKKLDPLEANLKMIAAMVESEDETTSNQPLAPTREHNTETGRQIAPEREPRRRQLTEEELRRMGRRAMPEEPEAYRDRSR